MSGGRFIRGGDSDKSRKHSGDASVPRSRPSNSFLPTTAPTYHKKGSSGGWREPSQHCAAGSRYLGLDLNTLPPQTSYVVQSGLSSDSVFNENGWKEENIPKIGAPHASWFVGDTVFQSREQSSRGQHGTRLAPSASILGPHPSSSQQRQYVGLDRLPAPIHASAAVFEASEDSSRTIGHTNQADGMYRSAIDFIATNFTSPTSPKCALAQDSISPMTFGSQQRYAINITSRLNAAAVSSAGRNAALESWYQEHHAWPYPNKAEKELLASASGKTNKQVHTWFVNKRGKESRGMAQNADRHIAQNLNVALFFGTQPVDQDYMQDEYLPAFNDYALPDQVRRPSAQPSPGPQTPLISPDLGRKGKRRFPLMSSAPRSPGEPLPTQRDGSKTTRLPCTFRCGAKDPKGVWEWKRHEDTHVPPTWFCIPDGTLLHNGHCIFCGEPDPFGEHVLAHSNVQLCLGKPLKDRGFCRKDKLTDHIRTVHLGERPRRGAKATTGTNLLTHWHREQDLSVSTPEALWCGFCRVALAGWEERQQHVGHHLLMGEDFQLGWQPFRRISSSS